MALLVKRKPDANFQSVYEPFEPEIPSAAIWDQDHAA
jgi:hypothetical protein